MFIGRIDAEAETPILWPPHVKSWLIGKDPDAGRDWRQEEKGTTEDEMAGWFHWLDGHEFEWTPRSWWWTGRPGVLWFMGSQRVRHDWATELNWTECDVTVVVVTLSWDFCLDSWYETFVNSPGIFWVDNLDEQMDPSLNGLINSWCFPGASDSKESTCNAGDLGLILGLGRSPGKGNSYPLQYSCLENSMDRGAWWLQSMGSQRIRHDWVTNIYTHTHILPSTLWLPLSAIW